MVYIELWDCLEKRRRALIGIYRLSAYVIFVENLGGSLCEPFNILESAEKRTPRKSFFFYFFLWELLEKVD